MEFGVIIHDMTYVVEAIISGISTIGLKGSFSGVRSCLLACGTCLTKLLYITPWPVKSCRTDR